MNQWLSEPVRIGLLAGVCIVLWQCEARFPYQAGPERRRAYEANLTLTFLVLALNLGLAAMTAWALAPFLNSKAGILHWISLPGWLAALAGIVGLDWFGYLAHRSMHLTAWGWRVHQVHHSTHVDVTTAFRQHPGETLIRFGFQLMGSLLLGVSPPVLVLYVTWSAFNAQLEHANVRVPEPVDRWVRLLLVTPNMHKLHHSCAATETDTNFANIFSIWDRLFRTYRPPTAIESVVYGLGEGAKADFQSCTQLLTLPFQFRR